VGNEYGNIDVFFHKRLLTEKGFKRLFCGILLRFTL
jgi:cold shock CspA family protein